PGSWCGTDPVRAMVPGLPAMPAAGIGLGDILDDSGYAHRDAAAWALPLRAAGAPLVQDLHPHDRGPKGTHDGAIISNGNLYCPRTPRPLLELGPLARTATKEQAAGHDRQTSELARHKLGRPTADDPDGHHRLQSPPPLRGTPPRRGARAGPARRSPPPPQSAAPGPPPASPATWPGTGRAAPPPTTPTAIPGCSAPPPWARSAARSAPPR